MKPRVHYLRRTALPLLAGLLGAASLVRAETTNSPTPAAGGSAPTAAAKSKPATPPAPAEIPKSVFVLPANPTVGKDPFFPRSTYPYGTTVVATSRTNTVATVPELVLSGISGTAEKPLAIINNVTFAAGDTGDVFVSGGKRLSVQCLEISLQARTAVVQASGQRQTLRLKERK